MEHARISSFYSQSLFSRTLFTRSRPNVPQPAAAASTEPKIPAHEVDRPPTNPQIDSTSNGLPPPITPTALPDTPSGLPARASLGRLLSLALPERRSLTKASLLLLFSSGVSLTLPLSIGRIIDYFASADPASVLPVPFYIAASALTAFFALGALANATRSVLFSIAGQRIVHRLRCQAYAASTRADVPWHDAQKGPGDIVSRLSVDANIVGDAVTEDLGSGLRAAVISVFGVAAMFAISSSLTTFMLMIVPPISISAVIYGRYIKSLTNQHQTAIGHMSRGAEEKLSAIRTVLASNAQEKEDASFATSSLKVYDLGKKEAIASAVFHGATGLAGNLTILALLAYGGRMVQQGLITVGDLSSLMLYTVYVGSSLSSLTGFFTSLMKGVGASQRVFALLDVKPAIALHTGTNVPSNPKGSIVFDNVSFSYPTRPNSTILRNLSFTLRNGESTAIAGGSGSGKSSIQQLLLRFYQPNSGCITYDGQNILEMKASAWRRMISVVPQEPQIFDGTVYENIAYGHDNVTMEDVEHAARTANCNFIYDLPQQFQTQIGRFSLSGGQKQRLSIARAILNQPSILILDEATSALDAGSELAVNDAIDRILKSQETTILVIAHRLSTLARAKNVLVLENGCIVEQGSYADLSSREDSRFRRLMAAQLNAT